MCTHSFGEWVTVSTATCEKEGTKERGCSKCDTIQTDTINKLEHTIVIDSYLAPTFTSTGLTEGSHCSVCKTVLTEQKEIPIQALEYTLRDDGNYTVSGLGTYIDNALVIPELYNNTAVVSIEKQAFLNCTHISSVVVPSTITSIGSGAFSGCSNIQKMELPLKGSLGRIFGTSPYEGCNSVEQIYMWGAGGTYYEYYYIPAKLTEITINSEEIGYWGLYNCSQIKKINITSNVKKIQEKSFYNCSGITSIVIPDSVTYIGQGAFAGCSNLESITLPFVGQKAIAESDISRYTFGWIFGTSAFEGATATKQNGLSSVVFDGQIIGEIRTYYIPNSLKEVHITGNCLSYGAFSGCLNIQSIYLSSALKKIEKGAIQSSCVTNIYFDGSMEKWEEVLKDNAWDIEMEAYTIVCLDGKLNK